MAKSSVRSDLLGPVLSTLNGNPDRYIYRPGETICSDGYVYRYSKRISPWYISVAHVAPLYKETFLLRRRLTLHRLEALRWRLGCFLRDTVTKRLRPVYEEVMATPGACVLEFDQHGVPVSKKVFSPFRYSMGDEFGITSETHDIPDNIIHQAGALDHDLLQVGEKWQKASDWSRSKHLKMPLIEELFSTLLAEYRTIRLWRMTDSSLSFHRRREQLNMIQGKVAWVTVNGRTYRSTGNAPVYRSERPWPNPSDLFFNADSEPVGHVYYRLSDIRDEPLSRPKRSKSTAAKASK